MKLAASDRRELAELAIGAANRAGAMIQAEAGKQREVLRKEGGTGLASQVVTAVDLESQSLILETLAPSMERFELGLLTEESADDESRHRRDFFWCIDPLDGTLPFIEGAEGYAVSIALVSREGESQIGVVLDPRAMTLYHAIRGEGAFRDGEAWTRAGPDVEEGGELTFAADRSFASQPDREAILGRVEGVAASAGLRGVRLIERGGAAMNACWVIENAPAIYFKVPKAEPGGGSLWDFAATACIFTELGAPVSDIRGAPLQLNSRESTFMNRDGVLYASDEGLAEAVRTGVQNGHAGTSGGGA